MPDPKMRSREYLIRKIMETYHYDRDNAEKALEYMRYKRAQYTWGLACGLVGANYARPFHVTLSNYNAFFRKPWMKIPIYAWAFGCAFYGGIQLSTRLFPKLTYSKYYYQGVTHPYYTSSPDMVSKFRLFENIEVPDTRDDLVNYLTVYSTDPLTKGEMVDQLALAAMKEFDFSKMFRVKRVGKDREPMFWCFGKIHGLENLAFASEDEVYAT
jgi:hypothetical protein